MKVWKVIHWVIIINFIIEIGYGFFQVFFVVGGGLPLFFGAQTLPYETMVTRRLYAIETWIAIVGLSIYLGITEMYPRFKDEIANKKSE